MTANETIPAGLPPLPPVPAGYDCNKWEYRGTNWKPGEFCNYAYYQPGLSDGWTVSFGMKPIGSSGHYIEAVRDEPEVCPECKGYGGNPADICPDCEGAGSILKAESATPESDREHEGLQALATHWQNRFDKMEAERDGLRALVEQTANAGGNYCDLIAAGDACREALAAFLTLHPEAKP